MAEYAVLGQSNTITGYGYASLLAATGHHTLVASGRVGASTSVLLPFFASDRFFNGAKYCLIDVCIVDGGTLLEGAFEISRMIQYINWIGHQCRRNGCEPIFILLATDVYMENPEPRALFYRAFEECIRGQQYYFLDARDVMRSTMKATGASYADLYQDHWHPNQRFSSILCEVIDRFLSRATPIRSEVLRRVAMPIFKRLKVSELADKSIERVSYRSSILAFDGIRLRQGERLQIETGRILSVCGFMVNTPNCHAKIRISGNMTAIKNLDLITGARGAFEARILNLSSPVSDLNSQIIISVCDHSETPTERTTQTKEKPSELGFVEIGDILVETGVEQVEYDAHALGERMRNLWILYGESTH